MNFTEELQYVKKHLINNDETIAMISYEKDSTIPYFCIYNHEQSSYRFLKSNVKEVKSED